MMKSTINVTYLGGPTIIQEIGGLRLMIDLCLTLQVHRS